MTASSTVCSAVGNALYGLSDEQARVTPTPSSSGGLVKHLAYRERGWADRIEGLPAGDGSAAFEQYIASFSLSTYLS